MNYQGKKCVVLGLGKSGLAAARLLARQGACVSIIDSNRGEALEEKAVLLRQEHMNIHLGAAAEHDSTHYDLAILSPGIDARAPLVKNVTQKGIPLIGELELAYSLTSHPIVAITGTNGKTTTTEMTTIALQALGLRTIACGNIGLPFSEALLKSDERDVFVLEVSSFQLEGIKTFRPRVAIWLNLSPNHLDRYATMEEYRSAKLRIFQNLQEDDFVVLPASFDRAALGIKAKAITFSTQSEHADFFFRDDFLFYQEEPFLDLKETQLHGLHNVENLMAACASGIALNRILDADLLRKPGRLMHGSLDSHNEMRGGIHERAVSTYSSPSAHQATKPPHEKPYEVFGFTQALSCMVEKIKNYTPPAHRCEWVGEMHGTIWINDSKSTTLDALEKAIQAIDPLRKIILIAGGKNKGSSFQSLLPLVKERVKVAFLIGELKHSIASEWSTVPCYEVENLEDAVKQANELALPGETILFSPGTSSYDMFADYQERGVCFKNAVQKFIMH